MRLPPNGFSRKPCDHQVTHPRPRVINVDGNASYPKLIAELKKTGELGRRSRCRPVRYLNNIVEQDHRALKRRVRASQGFRSFWSTTRTIQGIETMNMIRKGQVGGCPRAISPGRVRYRVVRTRRCCLYSVRPAGHRTRLTPWLPNLRVRRPSRGAWPKRSFRNVGPHGSSTIRTETSAQAGRCGRHSACCRPVLRRRY
jgi:hypothetical protein